MALIQRRVNFDETWQKISDTVDAVICLKKVTTKDWNERFTDVYSMCVAYPEPLVERLYEEVKKLLTSHVDKIYKEISSETYYLQLYHKHWSQYYGGCRFLNLLFRHLNQHIKKERQDGGDISPFVVAGSEVENMLEVGELALEIWREAVIEPMKEKLVAEILVEIGRDRNGENTQHSVIKAAIESFVVVQEYYIRGKLQLYESEFERKLLEETREFYRTVSARLVSEFTCSVYLVKADNLIREEKIRASRLFHNSSTNKVNKECEGQLVESHVNLLQSECKQMIRDENLEDLGRMYSLMKSSVTGLRSMVQLLEDNIKEKGLETVRCIDAEKTPHNYVDALLRIHRKYFNLINNTFNGDKAFFKALDQACYVIVNTEKSSKKSSQSAELLARYADSILKKSQRNLNESEQEEKMADIIIVFKYLDNKDVFQMFFAKMLAKRLIHNLSVSMDAEENMINRLKHTCGYEYTNNLHRMFTDMSLSGDLNKNFIDGLKDTDRRLEISTSFLILQVSY
ncbi:cullin-2-like [Dendronephthya gigantea]|uniref:cullin-2-like n=1 Tax=Dendronephthya gigantea TaxID=151771 RepID=UPI00106AF43A|nr:cullin-2-like [Dendronephthya gigantea]